MRFKKLLGVLIFLLPTIVLLACGGGGGGGDSDGDDEMNYSGLTTAAEISELNAEDISGGALGAGLIGDGMMTLGLEGDLNNSYVNKFRSVKIPAVLSESLHFLNFTVSPDFGVEAAVETIKETIKGNCGGSMYYFVSADSKDGTFSGNFNFKEYCSDGTKVNGKASFDGIIDVDTGDFIEAYFSFDNLSGGDLKLNGDIEIDYSASPNVIRFNAYGQDPASKKVFWIRNYKVTIIENSGFIEIEMTGKFYHPKYGYVKLSTTDPFILHDGDEWPTSGTLIVEGANNAKAKLTVIDNANCAIEADVDGDDSYEWASDTLNWDEI